MTTEPSLFCRQCGSRVSSDLRYCPECGAAIEERRANQPPVVPPPAPYVPPSSPYSPPPVPYDPAPPVSRSSGPPRIVLAVIGLTALIGALAAATGLILLTRGAERNGSAATDERPLATTVQPAETRTTAPTAAAVATGVPALPTIAVSGVVSPLPLPTVVIAAAATVPPTAAGFAPIPVWELQASASQTAPSGVDACGSQVSYPATNLLDGDPATAWRVLGDGVGNSIDLALARPYLISGLSIIVGYAKYDPCDRNVDRWPQGYRASELLLTFSDGSTRSVLLRDIREPQTLTIDPPVRSDRLRITLLSSNPPLVNFPNRYAAISEFALIGAP